MSSENENDEPKGPQIPDFSGPVDGTGTFAPGDFSRQPLSPPPAQTHNQPPKQAQRRPDKPEGPPAQRAPAQYFMNATQVDQSVIGPDGSSRVCPPKSYIHRSQFGNPGLPEKCQRVGIFVGVRNLDSIALAGSRDRKLIVGGELNNAKGHYHRSAA